MVNKKLFGKKLQSIEDLKDGIPDGYGEYRIPEKGEYFGEWKAG